LDFLTSIFFVSGGMRQIRPGVWEVRLEAGRDPVTGRRLQLSRSVTGTKRDAQKVLNELAVEADKGRFTGTATTFSQLSEQWLALVGADLSPTTLRTYQNLLSKRILPSIGSMPIKSIQASDLDLLYNGLLQRIGLAPKSVRQIHAIIRRAFRQAILWGWVNTNPAANATPPRLRKSELSPPDADQVETLLRAANHRDPEFANFLHIAATTGARRGEVCALRWSNVDFGLGTLTIERNIVEIPGNLIEKDTKTHANRRIALDSDTLVVFKNQLEMAQLRAELASTTVGDNDFVFSREPDGSKPWTPDSVTKRFVVLRNQLGYENMRLHDLRHFAATRLIAAGVPVRTVSGRLGHANPSTTLSVYSHFVEASDRDAAVVMGGLVSLSSSRSPVVSRVEPVRKSSRSAPKKR
jgi:integrase